MELRREHKTRQGGHFLRNADGSLTRITSAESEKKKPKPEKKTGVQNADK